MLCLDAMIPIKWEGVYKITLTTTVIHILVNTLYVSFQCVLASWIKFTLFTVKCYSVVHSPNVHVHVTVSDKVSLTLSKHTRKHFLTTEGHTIVNTLCVSFQCSLVSCFEFTFVTSKVESFMQSLYMPHHFTPLGVCIITLCTLLLHPFMAFQMTFQAWNTKNSQEPTQIIRVYKVATIFTLGMVKGKKILFQQWIQINHGRFQLPLIFALIVTMRTRSQYTVSMTI